jgi:hypothetical protein
MRPQLHENLKMSKKSVFVYQNKTTIEIKWCHRRFQIKKKKTTCCCCLQRPAGIKNKVCHRRYQKKEKKLPVVVGACRGQLEALGARVLLHEARELPCVLTAQLVRYSLTHKIIKRKNGKQRYSLVIWLIFFLFLQTKPSLFSLFAWSQAGHFCYLGLCGVRRLST